MTRYKLNIIIVLSLTVLLGFNACNSEETVPNGYMVTTDFFKVVNDTLHIGRHDTLARLTITADCDWSLKTSGWDDLHATPDHGEGTGEVTIKTPKNSRPKKREGVLLITTGSNITKKMILVQDPDTVRLQVSQDSLSFGIGGGKTEITVDCNTTWSVRVGDSWCRADTIIREDGTGAVIIEADSTSAKEPRETSFTIEPTGGKSKTISVKQTNKDISLSVSPKSLNFNATAIDPKEFTVDCNDEWTAVVSQDWLELDTHKAGSTNLTAPKTTYVRARCEDNTTGTERTATIIVSCAGKNDTINVTQRTIDIKEAHFNVTLGQMKTDGTGGTLAVTSDTTWTVTCDEEWCKLTVSSNEADKELYRGRGTVTMEFEDNKPDKERIAKITFMPSGLDSVVISVRQKEGSIEIELSADSLRFGGDGGELQEVRITSNGRWTAARPEWVILSDTAGNGDTDLKVSCQLNYTGRKRENAITISSADHEVNKVVRIVQDAPTLPELSNLVLSYTIGLNPTVTAEYSSVLPVTEYGVVYATHEEPTVNDSIVSKENREDVRKGDISAELTGLKPDTYYIRAFALSAAGVGYSEEKSLTIKTKPNQDDNAKPDLELPPA